MHSHEATELLTTLTPSPLKPHIVVVPFPGQGHVNPFLHLSRRLAMNGFSVTFVSMNFTHMFVMKFVRRLEKEEEEGKHQPQAEGETNYTLHPSTKLDIKFVSIPDGIPADTRINDVPELCRGMERSSSAFERLLEELQPRPTCIISDMFVLHTRDAAKKFGIPRAVFWTQSASSYAAHLAAARGLVQVRSGAKAEEKVITNIVGAPPLRVKDFVSFLCDPSGFLFGYATRPFIFIDEGMCILMNTFDALEGEAMEALRKQQPECNFYTVGPVLPMEFFSGMKLSMSSVNKTPGFWVEDYTCLMWLDKQEEGSVLYVSFGSTTELSGQDLEEFALGLEASGLPVLWVLHPGLFEGGGRTALPPGFEERNQGRVLVIEWAPQLHVLAHPAVGAMFTHGGWNSVLEGVAQGKPILGFPYFADQMLNCRCVEEKWGNGLALEQHAEGFTTRSLVESQVRALMTDSKVRQSAAKLREAARLAVLRQDPGSSTANLNTFIHGLLTYGNSTQ